MAPDSLEVQLARLAGRFDALEKGGVEQGSLLKKIGAQTEYARRQQEKVEARLTDLEGHSRSTVGELRDLKMLVERRNVDEATNAAARRMLIGWIIWGLGGITTIWSLWTGKFQSALETAIKLLGTKP